MYSNKTPSSNQKRPSQQQYEIPPVKFHSDQQDGYYLDGQDFIGSEINDPYQQPYYLQGIQPSIAQQPQFNIPLFYEKNQQLQQAMNNMFGAFQFPMPQQGTPSYIQLPQSGFQLPQMDFDYQFLKQTPAAVAPNVAPEPRAPKKPKKLRMKVKMEQVSEQYVADDARKQLFDNTLTGYVLKIFEIHQQVPLTENYVVEQVRANMHRLKRPDGTKYKGNLYKTVKGSLTSNGIFRKLNGDGGSETYWMVNKDSALEFEKRTVQRILHLADKRKFLKRVRTQRSTPIEDELIPDQLLFQESQSMQQPFQQTITNKYSHVYNLLDGFIRSQKENKHVRDILEQCETMQVTNMEDYMAFGKLTQGYDMKEVLEGIQECYTFFNRLFQEPKVEDLSYDVKL